jgi:hypothetical protein
LETRLAPAVSAWFLLVYSVIISVMNAVWIHLHRLLFGLFTVSQITGPKNTFICIWSPRNIWGLTLILLTWRKWWAPNNASK